MAELKPSDKKTIAWLAAGAGGCLVIVLGLAVAAGMAGGIAYWLGQRDDGVPEIPPASAVDPGMDALAAAGTVTVQGRVMDGRTGEPIPNALVRIIPSMGSVTEAPIVGYTDPEGLYRFQLPRGKV